jgi:hypothetical protein
LAEVWRTLTRATSSPMTKSSRESNRGRSSLDSRISCLA